MNENSNGAEDRVTRASRLYYELIQQTKDIVGEENSQRQLS